MAPLWKALLPKNGFPDDREYDFLIVYEAAIPIDIRDPSRSETIIRDAIAQDAYSERLPYILKAKKQTLERSNTVKAAQQLAAAVSSDQRGPNPPPVEL